jgi:class 3 adenylate cyclase
MAASLFASVTFLKIQEFARRPVSEQARLRAQLIAVVAVTAAEIEPARRIVLDASDGVAVVVLGDPEAALRLGERALTAVSAGLPLSAGLNHGAVQLAENPGKGGRKSRGAEGMAGDGIAVAASIAGFASPPQLLASRAFRDALADAAPGREAALVPAGTFTDAGLRAHEAFRPDARAPRRREWRYRGACVASALVLLGAGIAGRVAIEGRGPFMDAWAAKYQSASRQGQGYWRSFVKRVGF